MRSSGFDQVSVEIYNKRLTRVTLIVIVIFVCLILRLWFLQIVKGPNYRTQSENNRIHLQSIPPFRGMLLDWNGELLVDNRPSYNIYIIPEQIQDRNQLLKSLKLLVGLNPDHIQKRLFKFFYLRFSEIKFVLFRYGMNKFMEVCMDGFFVALTFV